MHDKPDRKSKEGAALVVALGILIMLPLIVMSLYFESRLEKALITYKRRKMHAEMLAKSGIEYAKAILDKRATVSELEIEELGEEDRDGFMQAALYAQRGLPTTSTIELGQGTFEVTIKSEEGGRNANLLTDDQWLDILEMANVPSTEWDAMVDCLEDWIDENDLHQLDGAESDDPFYEEQGYPVKNAPLDSVEELLLVKNWGPDVLYGKPADDESAAIYGIADLLTVWGDGKVNLNTATTNLLLSYAEYEDWELAGVMETRAGLDGEEGTLDDGIKSLAEVNADASKFKLQSNFVRVTSVGDSFGNRYEITCIFQVGNQGSIVLYWNEGPVIKDANTR